MSTPPTRCARHLEEPANHPCRPCRDAREYAEDWHRQQALADREAASRAARQRADLERAEARRCPLCAGTGYVGPHVCHHRPGQADVNARGVRACREALVEEITAAREGET